MEQLKIGQRIEQQRFLVDENTQILPYYIFSANIDTNLYYDITSVSSWMNTVGTYFDFIFRREQSSIIVNNNGWSSLTQTDKYFAAYNFIVDKTNRNEIFTEDEQKKYWGDLLEHTYNARLSRWKSAKSYMSYNLNVTESSDIAKTTKLLSEDYIDYDIKTLTEDGFDGLFDWITSTNNFSNGNGFSSKPYWSQTHQDNLMRILKYGIY